MPKLIATDELDALLRAAAGFPNGASIEEIRSAPGIVLPKRTLQRRLAQLVEQKHLVVTGRGRRSRYTISPTGVQRHVLPGEITINGYAPRVEIYIPTSPEGGNIYLTKTRLALIIQPSIGDCHGRIPVQRTPIPRRQRGPRTP